ncbi:MAG: phosphoribosyl-AMP cyclohydrolase [Clostridia bacterium]|nr:phosphoribosyl-AMP cyclohydrolase [Clostridia bacterium]
MTEIKKETDLSFLFAKSELIPAIVQDVEDGTVLMLAYMNESTLKETLEIKKCVFYSRSRKKRWLKGETSGNYQNVEEMYYDCDADTLLIKVRSDGPACHTGSRSCFFNRLY